MLKIEKKKLLYANLKKNKIEPGRKYVLCVLKNLTKYCSFQLTVPYLHKYKLFDHIL